MERLVIAGALSAFVVGGCMSYGGEAATAGAGARGRVQRGKASWYGSAFHGRKTASGERYDRRSLTAAHRTLPFDTVVRVTNLRNGRRVQVRINNRGPFIRGRIIDVSERAAAILGMRRAGVVPCTVEVLRYGKRKRRGRR